MNVFPDGTKVYVDASNGAYVGTIIASGTQATIWYCKVKLDDKTGWPDEISDDVVIVIAEQIRSIINMSNQLPPLHGFTNMQNLINSQPTIRM